MSIAQAHQPPPRPPARPPAAVSGGADAASLKRARESKTPPRPPNRPAIPACSFSPCVVGGRGCGVAAVRPVEPVAQTPGMPSRRAAGAGHTRPGARPCHHAGHHAGHHPGPHARPRAAPGRRTYEGPGNSARRAPGLRCGGFAPATSGRLRHGWKRTPNISTNCETNIARSAARIA